MIRLFLRFLLATTAALWSVQTSGVDTNLRGVSAAKPADGSIPTSVWATGSNGVILHSLDSGKTWERLHIANTEELDFRGVQAFGEKTAYVMASGEGEKSGIFKTLDGGKTWEKQYANSRKEFFLDAIECSSSTECFALSDPVGGKFLMIQTIDGAHWKEMPGENMPPALPKEGAFAASNTCMILFGTEDIYFGTGGPAARIFHSIDRGKSWTVSETPVLSGKAAEGIFSVARRGNTLVVMGGDYEFPKQAEKIAAYSLDKGKTWKLASNGPKGYRSAVVASDSEFIAAGPTGAEISNDGITWKSTGSPNLNAIVSAGGETWGAGPKGTVSRLVQDRENIYVGH